MPRVALTNAVIPALSMRKWNLWKAPRSIKTLVLAVDVLGLLTAAWALVNVRFSDVLITETLTLLVLGLGFEALSSRIEKLRVRIRVIRHVDMTSVWTFAAAVVLPLGIAVPLLVILRIHMWVKVQKPGGGAPYRAMYTACTVWIACLVAHEVMLGFTGIGSLPDGYRAIVAVLLAICSYTVANASLIFAAVWLGSRPDSPPLRSMWSDTVFEVSTLALAGLAALALMSSPWLTILVVPAMFMLQRSVFTKELQEAATVDAKTGLLNATTWQQVANVELERSRRGGSSATLLIIDMDNFKIINDTYGHLSGDAVLKAVANVLTDELRAYDSVGRFGGEEFVALLPKVDALEALAISDRILQRVRDLVVPIRGPEGSAIGEMSVSIGIACYPQQGDEVEDLLHVADAALYTAKREGRDRVEYSYIA
jgi:diguanylate cyclase (GGDEF)-like protein